MAIFLFIIKCYLIMVCLMGLVYWCAFRLEPSIIDEHGLRNGNRAWTTLKLMLLSPIALLASLFA